MADPHSTSQDIEIWKPIAGYENYIVSNRGRVARLMKPQVNVNGYPTVMLYIKRRIKNHPIHQIVAFNFIGPRPDGFQINHIDGNKRNPDVFNLEYVTRSENSLHAHRTGLVKNQVRGERSPHARLTASDVRRIRKSYKSGGSFKGLARKFGISNTHVRAIVRRTKWAHVIDIEAKEVKTLDDFI